MLLANMDIWVICDGLCLGWPAGPPYGAGRAGQAVSRAHSAQMTLPWGV